MIDGAVIRADGSRALIECKREWSGFRTRRGEIQAFLGRVAALALGMGYERWSSRTRAQICAGGTSRRCRHATSCA